MKEIFDTLKLNDYVYQIMYSMNNGIYKCDIRKLKIIDIDKKGRNIDIRLEHGVKFSTTSNKTHCKEFYTSYKEAKEVLLKDIWNNIENLKSAIYKNNLELERYRKLYNELKNKL